MSEPQSIREIMEEYFTDEGQHRAKKLEQSYRRGYHQAWDNAIDAIFAMLNKDISQKDAYAMCALHVNGLANWRASVPHHGIFFEPPPGFNTSSLQSALEERRRKLLSGNEEE